MAYPSLDFANIGFFDGVSAIGCSPSSFLYIVFTRFLPFKDNSYKAASPPDLSLHLVIQPSLFSLYHLTLSHDIILLNSMNFALVNSLSLCRNSSISRSG